MKKKSTKHTSYRRRYMSLTPNDRHDIKLINKRLKLVALAFAEDFLEEDEFYYLVGKLLKWRKKVEEVPDDHVFMKPSPRKRRRFIDFQESDIPALFRFKTKAQLLELKEAFELPAVIDLGNRVQVTDEKMILVGLMRLSYPGRLINIVLEFGGDISIWSRCIKYFVNFLFSKFSHLVLHGGIERFAGSFESYAAAIKTKLVERGVVHMARTDMDMVVFAFIDNCIFHTEVLCGGPQTEGCNSDRYNKLIQRAYYTGWKHLHGLKIQTITLPNGLIADVYGPSSVRKNDVEQLKESNINTRLRDLLVKHNMRRFAVYGDSAYSVMSNLFGRHEGDNLIDELKLENLGMAAVRETIEWVNKDIKSKFAFIGYFKSLRISDKMCHRNIINKLLQVSEWVPNVRIFSDKTTYSTGVY